MNLSEFTRLTGFSQSIAERDAMRYACALMWAITGFAIFLVGLIAPELAPGNLLAWQIILSFIGVTCVISQVTWMRDLEDDKLHLVENFWNLASIGISLALMVANELSIAALFVSLIVPAAFAAQFFRRREVIFQTIAITIVAIVPLIVHAGDLTGEHVISRIAAFLPILWVVVVAVWTLRRNREAAVAGAEQAAKTDPLTGLPNLSAFNDHADKLIGSGGVGEVALLLIDLDDFKSANTLHGHAGGDHLLRVVGTSLARAKSADHLVARIGGDEFAVLLKNASAADLEDQAIRYANAVRTAQREIDMPGVTLDASVGTAITPTDGVDIAALMTAADRSMYAAKAKTGQSRRPTMHARERHEKIVPAHRRAAARWIKTDEQVAAEQPGATDARLENALFAAMTWAIGVSIGLFSLLMPDADRTHGWIPFAALLGGYVVAVLAYYTAPPVESKRHIFNDVFTLASIGVITYLTGGSASPLWPLVYLFIVYEAWFLGWKRITMRIVGPTLVILAPVVYEGVGSFSSATGAALYSGVLVAAGLTVLLSYDQANMQRAQDTAREQSRIDPRTGLANRREFELQVNAAFSAKAADTKLTPAIVMLDLDNFKSVNTEHGHAAGDRLIVEISRALASCTRAEDCIARVGGDEFAVVLPEADVAIARHVAQRYVDAVTEAARSSRQSACRKVTASAGYALYGVHGHDFDELINAADAVLMKAKTERGDQDRGGLIVTPG